MVTPPLSGSPKVSPSRIASVQDTIADLVIAAAQSVEDDEVDQEKILREFRESADQGLREGGPVRLSMKQLDSFDPLRSPSDEVPKLQIDVSEPDNQSEPSLINPISSTESSESVPKWLSDLRQVWEQELGTPSGADSAGWFQGDEELLDEFKAESPQESPTEDQRTVPSEVPPSSSTESSPDRDSNLKGVALPQFSTLKSKTQAFDEQSKEERIQ